MVETIILNLRNRQTEDTIRLIDKLFTPHISS
jgi:hypothetical protein